MALLSVTASPVAGELARADTLPASSFPWAGVVREAAGTLREAAGTQSRDSLETAEGPRAFVVVSPGSIRLTRCDLAKAARRQEADSYGYRPRGGALALGRHGKLIAQAVGYAADVAVRDAEHAVWAAGLLDVDDHPAGDSGAVDPGSDPLAKPRGRSRIVSWSRKSRAAMTARLCSLDYAPLVGSGRLAMATLTLPDDWERVAPTGSEFKALVRAWQERYRRAWGARVVGIWKLEFQGRGAPHLHMLIAPPEGVSRCGRQWRAWFSETWADLVARPGAEWEHVRWVHSQPVACEDYAEGSRCVDPRRVAVYFTKHGLHAGKEYQHDVPALWQAAGAGPGRFWGVWGLVPVEVPVQVTYEQAVKLARVARKHAAAQRGTRVSRVMRVDRVSGVVSHRSVRRRVRRLGQTWGFLAATDGPALALMLSDFLRGAQQVTGRAGTESRASARPWLAFV